MHSKHPHYIFGCVFAAAIAVLGCSKNGPETQTGRAGAGETLPDNTDRAASDNTSDAAANIIVDPASSESIPASVDSVSTDPGVTQGGDAESSDAESSDAESSGNLYDDALAAMESGDLDTAFTLVRRAKAAAPDDPDTTFLMAHVLAERNRFAEAIKLLDDLAGEIPDAKLPVLGQTADWMVASGQWREAERRYRELLDQVPDASMAQRMLAQLLLREGRRQDAASYLHQLCQSGVVEQSSLRSMLRLSFPLAGDASTDDLEPIGPLGIARSQISRGEWQDALKTLEDAQSNDPSLVALTGRILAKQNNFDALQKWSDDIAEPLDGLADYWYAIGRLRLHQERYDAAIECFCRVVLIDPTDDQAYLSLGETLNALQRTADANIASQRAELINSTHTIGERLSQAEDIDLSEVEKLIRSLEQLQRPFEALAWRVIEVSLRRSQSNLSDDEVRQRIAEINEQRLQLLQSESPGAAKAFILCGIDYESL